MLRWPGLLLIGLLAYSVFVTLRLPVAWWLNHLPVPTELLVDNPVGTVWRGNATGIAWRGTGLGALAWRMTPGSLPWGRLTYQLRLTGNDYRLATHLTPSLDGSLRLDRLSGTLPLPLLARLSGQALMLDGRLDLDLDRLDLDDRSRPTEIRGTLQLRQATLYALPDQPVGPFLATVETVAPTTIAASIQDQGGPVALNARLQLEPDGVYRVTGQLGARPDSPPQLTRWLAALADDGRLDLTGRWF